MAKNYVTFFRGESCLTPSANDIKDEPVSPTSDDFGNYSFDYKHENGYCSMRKSLSMNDIANIERDNGYQRHKCPERGLQEFGKTKFVSMAEAIYHYHKDTPSRFHSTKPQTFRPNITRFPIGLTVPQSPMLRCKARSRPVNILSQKEKEEIEIEEIKKHQIKAHPIPKFIKEGVIKLPEVPKKTITVPEPFHLTEVQKKNVNNSPQIQKFKARSAPKHILEKPQIPLKPPVHTTKPVSPKWHYKKTVNYSVSSEKSQSHKLVERNHQRLGPVKPEPFSFEKRNEELKKRKEEWIKKQIENDRKQACQFKANPLPGAIKKQTRGESARGCPPSKSSGNKENHM